MHHARLTAATFFAAFVLSAASGHSAPAFAQAVSRPAPLSPNAAPDPIRIYLMTMGQGDEVYELFGHNAIWVHDPNTAFDVVYNWGVFDFRTPGFVGRFLMGDMRYMMVGELLDNTLAQYKAWNRQVWAQELNLTPAEKRALIDFMQWNARPENATYRYDYYLDNCSTRVRDVIDRVVRGEVRAYLRSIRTEETYRTHSLRLMQSKGLMVSGVELALGRPTDVKLTADQASFLPMQLMRYIGGVKRDGGTRPLVGEAFVVYQATRPPEPTTTPKLWKAFVPLGLLLAAIVLWLARAGDSPSVRKQRALATMIAIVAGFCGVIGTMITFLVTVTDHVAAHSNENMFMLNPLWLAVAVLGPMLILRRRARTAAVVLVLMAVALGCGAVLIHLIGLSRQPNWDAIGLLLPVELAIAWILVAHGRAAMVAEDVPVSHRP